MPIAVTCGNLDRKHPQIHQAGLNRMLPEPENRSLAIEAWFRQHDHADSDFAIAPQEHSSTCVGDVPTARTVVYTTKPRFVLGALAALHFPEPIAVLGRYGLPCDADLPLLRSTPRPAIFLGDCDPPDLLAYAWLRAHLPMDWYGVSDHFLRQQGTREADSIQIPMQREELDSMAVLPRLCPGFREIVGAYCAALLVGGRKIELEGAMARFTKSQC